jgi:hypothetical protein
MVIKELDTYNFQEKRGRSMIHTSEEAGIAMPNFYAAQLYQSYYEICSNPFQQKVIKRAWSSFSGVLFCYLTTLRERVYFEREKDDEQGLQWKLVTTPSDAISIPMRIAMEPIYALLALAAAVEFAVRLPFCALAGLFLLCATCADINYNQYVEYVIISGIWGEIVLAATVVASVQAIYFNLFNSSIVTKLNFVNMKELF